MTFDTAPVVAHVIRGDVVESVHHGIAAVVDPTGAVIDQVGDPMAAVFARSANKPLQALAMLQCGLTLPSDHLALACASHSGEPHHVAGVRSMLGAHGFSEADLQNTPDLPWDEAARNQWLADGHEKSPVAQNCSGKHAAMLATCRAAGWDHASYRDPDHPLQERIAQVIAEEYGEEILHISVDGCGAPVHQSRLAGLAKAFGTLAVASQNSRSLVADAMRTHPELVAGTGRMATTFMEAVPGAIAKDGAEGVLAIGLPDGHGVAVKILDGNERATGVLAAALLRRIGGVEDDALALLGDWPVLGHGQPVGHVISALGPGA